MAEKAHLIILPLVNPDGRARYPYKSVWGLPNESFRYFAQGTWKDGSLCSHPECKKYHPIKDYVETLGCYFNEYFTVDVEKRFCAFAEQGASKETLAIAQAAAEKYPVAVKKGDSYLPKHL